MDFISILRIIWDFVKSHYDLILSIVSLIVLVVLTLLKKKVKVGENPWIDMVLKLPGYINEAEDSKLTGDGKLQFVVAKALDFLSSYYGDIVFGDKALIKNIVAQIENILSTPQKKE